MKRAKSVLACVLLAAVASCHAGQSPQPFVPNTNPNPNGGDDTILKDLLEQMNRQRPTLQREGLGPVQANAAAMCNICAQPLYKHGDANFDCAPVDPETGKPKLVPKIHAVPVKCPTCTVTFSGALPGNINDRGGRDRDFCAHSIGKVTVHSNVWMCPECGYAGMIPQNGDAASFALGLDGKPVSEKVKAFVREKFAAETRKRMIKVAGLKEENPPAELLQFGKYVQQQEIPDWMKYDNALQIYESLNAPHALLSRLYLEAAHSCRREVCSEVAAASLDKDLQDSLGKSINRMGKFVQSECLTLRRKRGDPLLDPTKAETEPKLLAQGVSAVIRVGRDVVAQRNNAGVPAQNRQNADNAFFTTSDMFILYIMYAGALDRLGRMDEADKALTEALTYVPERLPEPLADKELEARVLRQLRVIRSIVQDRQACLKREEEYLFKAAKHNVAAIKFKEIKFKEPKVDPNNNNTALWDPAPTSYLLGELLRRSGQTDVAAAWFNAADRIIEKSLETVEAAIPKVDAAAQLPQNLVQRSPLEQQREHLRVLKSWSRDQGGLIKNAKPADEIMKPIIDQVISVMGLDPNAAPVKSSPAAAATDDSLDVPLKAPATAKTDKPVALPSNIKTREDLYKMYYAALMKYRNDKKENAPSLSELVTAGYISAASASLDENGKLVCPETKQKLLYLRKWAPEQKSEVLLPMKPGSKILYSTGEIGEPGKR